MFSNIKLLCALLDENYQKITTMVEAYSCNSVWLFLWGLVVHQRFFSAGLYNKDFLWYTVLLNCSLFNYLLTRYAYLIENLFQIQGNWN